MRQQRIAKAKEALVLCLQSLPKKSRFNIVSFGTGYNLLYENSVEYTNATAKETIHVVKQMQADLGGTEILNPLKHQLEKPPTPGYPRQVFLLTDGGVSNTEVVVYMVGKNTKYARVHTIGIGNGASESLIRRCAEKGKGNSVFIQDN